MIFLNKKIYNKKYIYYKNINLLYFIKIINDFIFFSFLIKEYIKIHNLFSFNLLKNFINLLNIIAIKYILYNMYNNIFNIKNIIYYKIYILELFYWKNKNFINYNKYLLSNNIEQKILLIKKVSKTRAKGRIKKYKIIIIIGNKSG